jgi:hypothetical protein
MANEICWYSDPAIWIYAAIVLVTAYGLALFVWWLFKARKPTEVYIYFTLLLGAIGETNAFNLIARYYWRNDNDFSDHAAFINSGWWKVRSLLLLVLLTAIIVRMTMRVIKNRKSKEEGL